jgi:transposase
MQARTAALNQLSALLVTAPDHLASASECSPGSDSPRRRFGCGHAPMSSTVFCDGSASASSDSRERSQTPSVDSSLLAEVAPDLLEECAVGPVCGTQLLVSSGDPGRMTSEASFAALAGTSPVEGSSGKQQRHRLNPGGDRQLNWALHVVALARNRHHAKTSAYYHGYSQRVRPPGARR